MGKKGQVWIETVIYLLIGLALISLILAFVIPRINQQRDRIIVDQAIMSFKVLDDKVLEVMDRGKDNKRIIDFNIKAGKIFFETDEDKIIYRLDEIDEPYSEPGVKIPFGRVVVETTEGAKTSSVKLTLDYSNSANMTFNKEELNPSSVPYRFSIENNGLETGSGLFNITLSVIS